VYTDPALRRGIGGADEKVPGQITDLFTDAAIEYTQQAGKPFCLWMSYNAPHSPWFAARRYRELYEGKENLAPPAHPKGGREFDWVTYYAVITHLDEAVGRLVTGLQKSGQWENTVLFFVGDNGFMCGSKNWNGKVVPWEESVRVPYFAAGGWLKGQGRIADPVASVDLPATWLDLGGVKPSYRMSGQSLRPFLTSGRGRREFAFSTWNDGRVGALATRQQVEPYRLVRTRDQKYILWESRKEAMFDIGKDPAEQSDLSANPEHRKMRERLRTALRNRMRETDDPALAWLG
jgi:arylsulfatase A-like enzyme